MIKRCVNDRVLPPAVCHHFLLNTWSHVSKRKEAGKDHLYWYYRCLTPDPTAHSLLLHRSKASHATLQLWPSATHSLVLLCCPTTSAAQSLPTHEWAHDGHLDAWCPQALDYKPRALMQPLIGTPEVFLNSAVKISSHSYTYVGPHLSRCKSTKCKMKSWFRWIIHTWAKKHIRI